MKLKKLKTTNHAHFGNFECRFADGAVEIWGMNESGKSSLMNSLLILFEGMKEKGQDCLIGDRFKIIGPAAKSMGVAATIIDEIPRNMGIVRRTR